MYYCSQEEGLKLWFVTYIVGGYLIVAKGRICDRAVGVGLWNWKEQNKNTRRSASVIYENTGKKISKHLWMLGIIIIID